MSFMNPWLLLAGLGIALPILAHLLNRYQVRRTDWAAMQFLNRAVRVRSRQIRLRDLLLLLLRCLAVLLIALAFARPTLENGKGILAGLGERRTGVIIALDASYSMQHSDGAGTRFERAVERIKTIAESIHPGDPVSLVLLADQHEVVVRNMAFDPERFGAILRAQRATPEGLDLDSLPRRLAELAEEMQAPQKEVYILTDLQERDWGGCSAWFREEFENLGRAVHTCVVPVSGGSDNLAITSLELVSGVLRKGTIARYRATVRNFGPAPALNVNVRGLADNMNVDTKIIPEIAAGASETVSLFVPFQDPGPVRITARLEPDSLPVDDSRGAVAVVRDRVSVLCVQGSSGGAGRSGELITAALLARGNGGGQEEFVVQSASWHGLPSQDLSRFDVVILSDVPDITPEQARRFEKYVREGKGLIWFPGEDTKAAVWNRRSALAGLPLLPAEIGQTVSTSDAMGVGGALDPTMPDHSVCRPLLSLPEDLLSEARFLKLLQVRPAATGFAVLSLAGSGLPVLLEHSIGRGHVFMFTTSAGPEWNNMAVTPVLPMVLQQMVTYLTAREFEKSRLVGNSLSLSYVDQPDASDAVFDTPSGRMVTIPVREHRRQYVALLEHARECGFYTARVSVQSPGAPIAVNLDTAESDVKCLAATEAARTFENVGVLVARSETELVDIIDQTRTGRSFWPLLLVAALAVLFLEGLVADRQPRSPIVGRSIAPTSTHAEGA